MELIEIQTLVDITNSGVRRINQGSQLEVDQYKNWTTLLQCIGMRSIIRYDSDPTCALTDITTNGFGSVYHGIHKVWSFLFIPDQIGAFAGANSRIELLFQDIDKVPIIFNLSETMPMLNTVDAAFQLSSVTHTNTIITTRNIHAGS